MKKLPCPTVQASDLGGPRVIVTFEWDWIALEMYEDQALLLARTIYDALQEQEPETDGGSMSPWGET